MQIRLFQMATSKGNSRPSFEIVISIYTSKFLNDNFPDFSTITNFHSNSNSVPMKTHINVVTSDDNEAPFDDAEFTRSLILFLVAIKFSMIRNFVCPSST